MPEAETCFPTVLLLIHAMLLGAGTFVGCLCIHLLRLDVKYLQKKLQERGTYIPYPKEET